MLVFLIDDNDQSKPENLKPVLRRAVSVQESITPTDLNGPISHLYCCSKKYIWASNNRGKLGKFDHSGNNCLPTLVQTCSTQYGHFTIATVSENKHIIFSVDINEKKIVKKVVPGETDFEVLSKDTGLWEPISIYFSDKTKKIYVGKLMHRGAKITRYKYDEKDFEKIDDILDYYMYPAYLAENTNGDICVSDNNRCVIVVDQDRKLRFKYTGPEQSGFTPHGICTDKSGKILILDSCSVCIHVLDQDGMFQHTIMLSKDLRQPRGLCIDDGGHFYVGTYSLISKYKYMTASQTTEESEK